jgi:murein DD-endopeptidase MepM/ murein hydrolase activator NlpD
MARHSQKPKHPVHIKRKLLRLGVQMFVWLGLAVIYYVVFSFFFDTPVEHGMKQSLVQLEQEYEKLNERYDTLRRVLSNVSERDRNLFRTLYDSDPLDLEPTGPDSYLTDSLTSRSNNRLAAGLTGRLARFEERLRLRQADFDLLQRRIETRGVAMNRIPSIQPVIDPDMTRIATSYGMRIHPFYRTMVMHSGWDYAVPEETRVFATADGTVITAASNQATTGTTLTIDHGNGYRTSYQHLSRILVREGSTVRRGDIVATTGDSGLSLAPHLHYEITLNGRSVDPVHYFFYELGPEPYRQIRRRSAVGMQSLD